MLTGQNPDRSIHAHHVFPQKYEKDFLEKGLNIHDPKYLTWWERSSHLSNARGYNLKWREFDRRNNNATTEQILQFGKEIMLDHKISTNY